VKKDIRSTKNSQNFTLRIQPNVEQLQNEFSKIKVKIKSKSNIQIQIKKNPNKKSKSKQQQQL